MSVSKSLTSWVWFIIRNGRRCSELFRSHRWNKRRLLYLGRTPTQTPSSQRGYPFLSREDLDQVLFRPLCEPSSMSTPMTSNTPLLVTVTSKYGQHKACFYGTQSQVVKQVNHFLMTGREMSGDTLPKKSLSDALGRALCLRYLELWLKDIQN